MRHNGHFDRHVPTIVTLLWPRRHRPRLLCRGLTCVHVASYQVEHAALLHRSASNVLQLSHLEQVEDGLLSVGVPRPPLLLEVVAVVINTVVVALCVLVVKIPMTDQIEDCSLVHTKGRAATSAGDKVENTSLHPADYIPGGWSELSWNEIEDTTAHSCHLRLLLIVVEIKTKLLSGSSFILDKAAAAERTHKVCILIFLWD